MSPRSEFLTLNSKKRHVIGYLQDFLFTPNVFGNVVKMFRGERNIMLARLFSEPQPACSGRTHE